MKSVTRTVMFRTLLIDDDEAMLVRLRNQLTGVSVAIGNRRIESVIDTMHVQVDATRGGVHFSDSTLESLLLHAHRRYDAIVLDYSYASRSMQTAQWGSVTQYAPPKTQNLLTVVDLKNAGLDYEVKHGGVTAKRINQFFDTNADIILRSLQHDSTKDSLGAYEVRYANTLGVFRRARHIYRMDSFQLIYGADPGLRAAYYDEQPRGREFYRNVAAQFIALQYQMSMYRNLLERSRKILIPRSVAGMSLIAVGVSAAGALISKFISPIADSIHSRDWISAASLAGVATIVTLLITLIVSVSVDRFAAISSDSIND